MSYCGPTKILVANAENLVATGDLAIGVLFCFVRKPNNHYEHYFRHTVTV